MKSKHNVTIIVVLAVLLFSVFYTLPSTKIWENAFGVIAPDEQVGVPARLLEYSAGEDGKSALVKIQVDKMAEIFNRAKNAAKPDDVLNKVAEMIRKTLVDAGFEARVINPDYENGNASIRVAGKTVDELKAGMASSKLYARLPLFLTSLFPGKKITLGLDLKGGIDLVYQVDLNSIQEET